MAENIPYEQLKTLIDTKKAGDHEWFLSLLDDEKQAGYEDEHMSAVMQMLRLVRIRPHKNAIREAQAEIARLEREEKDSAESKSDGVSFNTEEFFEKALKRSYAIMNSANNREGEE